MKTSELVSCMIQLKNDEVSFVFQQIPPSTSPHFHTDDRQPLIEHCLYLFFYQGEQIFPTVDSIYGMNNYSAFNPRIPIQAFNMKDIRKHNTWYVLYPSQRMRDVAYEVFTVLDVENHVNYKPFLK